MSSLNPSYFSTLQNVATTFSDRTALSVIDLKKDILTAFHAMQIFAPRAMTQYTNSYGARFPASWTTSCAYHTPGTRLTGQTDPPKRAYRDILLDDRLVTHLFVDELDANARAVINFQTMFAQEMGHAIAKFDDINCAIVAILAARAAATVTGGDGGLVLTKPNCSTNIGALNAVVWDSKNGFDEKSVSPIGRTLALRPAQFNLMAATLDRAFHRDLGQGGSIGASVSVPSYAGYSEIKMSNNIPNTNIASSPTGSRNTYNGDFTKTVGVAFSNGAFGTVLTSSSLPQGGGSQPNPVGTDTETPYQPLEVREVPIKEAYGTLYIASLVTGHGILNPTCAIEIAEP